MSLIRSKILSFLKNDNVYKIRGLTESEETKLANTISATKSNIDSALQTTSGTSKFYREDGTWGVPPGTKPYVVTLDTVTNTSGSYTHTTNVSNVNSGMKAIQIEVSNPDAFQDKITITTGDGTITLSCSSVSGTSDVSVTIIQSSSSEQGIPGQITSSEFDILAARIGTLSQLNTTEKGNVVAAVNEVKGSIPSVVNNLTSDSTTAALSAAQGKALNSKITPQYVNASTLAGLKTALIAINGALQNNADTAIFFALASNEDVFSAYVTYTGTLHRQDANNFSCNVSSRLGQNVVIGYSNGSTWVIYSPSNKISMLFDGNHLISDANSATETGSYYFTTGSNLPFDYGQLIVYKNPAGWIVQTAYAILANVCAFRTCNAGTWSGWTDVALNSSITTINNNLANKVDKGSAAGLAAIELSPGAAGHGGYIDFHFNGSAADYTSRIIENAAGNIDINGISITGLNQAVSGKQERFVLGSLTGTTSASGNLQLDVTDTNARVVCAWSDTGATCCIPYCETNGRWWVHCISDSSSYSVRANTRLTIYYYYFKRAL